MNNRDSFNGQDPDWSHKANEFKPATIRETHETDGMTWLTPENLRKLKPVKPVEHSLVDSWYFLVPMALIAIAMLVARSQGWL